MEKLNAILLFRKLLYCCISCYLLIAVNQASFAQAPATYSFKNGRMYIELNKQITQGVLDSFIAKFNLYDIPLKSFMSGDIADSLVKLGWTIDVNDRAKFMFSKHLAGFGNLDNPADRIMLAEKHPDGSPAFPVVSSAVKYGYNRFKNKYPFSSKDSTVTFFLRSNLNAKRVNLAGSFNDWQPEALRMSRTDSGWIATVKLGPGKYWYKFIVDGGWMLDADNLLKENDGIGNDNSVFYKSNYLFRLDGYTNNKKVYLSGNFNNWKGDELLMYKTSSGWQLPIYLADGTHTYRYVVDGEWIYDAKNPNRLPNEFKSFNSYIEIGQPFIFRLPGYTNAKIVTVSGSFNGWRDNELFLAKNASGWELPYALGPGNYEYKFKVDDKWIADPANPPALAKQINSILVIAPNYTFRLKGYSNAGSVFLSGDFNNWSPNAFPMKKDADGWLFQAHLSSGKHRYKFVVDGNWIIDPGNKLWEQNEFGTGNSVVWIEK